MEVRDKFQKSTVGKRITRESPSPFNKGPGGGERNTLRPAKKVQGFVRFLLIFPNNSVILIVLIN